MGNIQLQTFSFFNGLMCCRFVFQENCNQHIFAKISEKVSLNGTLLSVAGNFGGIFVENYGSQAFKH